MLLLLASTLLGTSGCGLFGVSPTLEVSYPRLPNSLDPIQASNDEALSLLSQLHLPLTTLEGAKVVPLAAEGWSVSESGTRYTILIAKKNWSDGVALQADDFAFSLQRHLRPGSRSVARQPLMVIAGAHEYHTGKAGVETLAVRALSPQVLEVRLTKADADFPRKLAHPALAPQRRDVDRAHGEAAHSHPLHLRTTGAYHLLPENKPSTFFLVANSYAPAPPKAAKVRIRYEPDSGAARAALQAGQLQIAHLVPGEGRFEKSPQVKQAGALPSGYVDFSTVVWRN